MLQIFTIDALVSELSQLNASLIEHGPVLSQVRIRLRGSCTEAVVFNGENVFSLLVKRDGPYVLVAVEGIVVLVKLQLLQQLDALVVQASPFYQFLAGPAVVGEHVVVRRQVPKLVLLD